jgi:hypothetical protein
MNEPIISRNETIKNSRKEPTRDGEKPPEHPYKLFDASEVAVEMEVPPKFISAIRKFGAPFLLGESHPAWVFDWVKEHAGEERFQGPLEPKKNRKR